MIISSPKFLNSFKELLGDGQQFGIKLFYESQPQPNGIAEAITIGKEFILGQKCALILGDNLLYGPGLGRDLSNRIGDSGATILAYQVANPSEFGVIEFDSNENPIDIIEKPKSPKSNWAIPGLYFYDESVTERVKNVIPSSRGEKEITDLNKSYLKSSELNVIKMQRGTAWLDLGNADSLLEASKFIQIIENRQGIMIGEPSEVAKNMNWI